MKRSAKPRIWHANEFHEHDLSYKTMKFEFTPGSDDDLESSGSTNYKQRENRRTCFGCGNATQSYGNLEDFSPNGF